MFVARKIEEDFLRMHGYHQASAIGLPYAYVADANLERRRGSLLVFPTHSLEMTQQRWRYQDYADTIGDLRSSFDTIIACIHPSCIQKGLWVTEFQRNGISWISGAHIRDANSLVRMKWLCSQFECVTTNGITSAIAYGAAEGAKTSIYGPYCHARVQDRENVPFYLENPGLASRFIPLFAEDKARKHLPSLFCDPREAKKNVDWGLEQIGRTRRVSPKELMSFLAGPRDLIECRDKPYRRSALVQVARWALPQGIADKIRARRRLEIDASKSRTNTDDERQRLQQRARHVPGVDTLEGKAFHFTDAHSLLWEYDQIFGKQCYDFPCIYEDPRIIDCGANIGVAVRYWLSKFPKARILAFEPDPNLFSCLQKNTAAFPSEQVQVINAAVWKRDEKLEFCSTGVETGHLSETQSGKQVGDTFKVNAIRLSQYLDQPVQFLKIDIEGAETEVICEIANSLSHVRRLWLEYHSLLNSPQSLGVILRVLEEQGFRYHIVTESVSERPLQRVDAAYGMDQRLNIWAYNGERFPRTVLREEQ